MEQGIAKWEISPFKCSNTGKTFCRHKKLPAMALLTKLFTLFDRQSC